MPHTIYLIPCIFYLIPCILYLTPHPTPHTSHLTLRTWHQLTQHGRSPPSSTRELGDVSVYVEAVVTGTVRVAHLLGEKPATLPDEESARGWVRNDPLTVHPGEAGASIVLQSEPDSPAGPVPLLGTFEH